MAFESSALAHTPPGELVVTAAEDPLRINATCRGARARATSGVAMKFLLASASGQPGDETHAAKC